MNIESVRNVQAANRQYRDEQRRIGQDQDFRAMRQGAARRSALLSWLRAGRAEGIDRRVYINRRHCILLKHDPDLQVLLKKGLIKQFRENKGYGSLCKRKSGSFYSYLSLPRNATV